MLSLLQLQNNKSLQAVSVKQSQMYFAKNLEYTSQMSHKLHSYVKLLVHAMTQTIWPLLSYELMAFIIIKTA